MNRSAEAIVTELIEKRGITEPGLSAFISPEFTKAIHSPQGLLDMDLAVSRIIQAQVGNERITIFGDYDADGVPATALLLRTLRRLGLHVEGIIPLRSEGYGLSMESVQQIIAQGTQLLITVDNGSLAKNEINALRERNIDTIVCDHHELHEGQLAQPFALINPKQSACTYPFKELCGCAIAWKLVWALYERIGIPTDPLKWEMDLVALATVADMVPLIGENRALVQFGLRILQRTKNKGIHALAKVSGLDLSKASEGDIGFKLAPRLNAPSRMHQELLDGRNAALELLTTDDEQYVQRVATYLNGLNSARQELVKQHMQEAELQIAETPERLCLVLFSQNWSSGVIGLVAGRMVETYRRPVIALATEGVKIKGSIRSVEGIHVLELLSSAQALFERFGGHAKAGGLTLRGGEEVIIPLGEALESWLKQRGDTLEMYTRTAHRSPDLLLSLSEANVALAAELQTLAPYGIGFEEPLFRSQVQLQAIKTMGSDSKHLSCLLVDGVVRQRAVGFGMGSLDLEEAIEYYADYTLQVEEWQGQLRLSCMLKRLDLVQEKHG